MQRDLTQTEEFCCNNSFIMPVTAATVNILGPDAEFFDLTQTEEFCCNNSFIVPVTAATVNILGPDAEGSNTDRGRRKVERKRRQQDAMENN